MHKGSCLCGAVRFEVSGALRPPDACHCSKCRKQSGHYLDRQKHDWIGVCMGAFDTPTNTRLKVHIVADQGDYYDIADGLPQNQQ